MVVVAVGAGADTFAVTAADIVFASLLRGFRFVTEAVGFVSAGAAVQQAAAVVSAVVFLFVAQQVVAGSLLVVLAVDVAAAVSVVAVLLPTGLAQAVIGLKAAALVMLLVSVSMLDIGENMRRVFSNIDMFCLLISSSVVPKGKMLPRVVWK